MFSLEIYKILRGNTFHRLAAFSHSFLPYPHKRYNLQFFPAHQTFYDNSFYPSAANFLAYSDLVYVSQKTVSSPQINTNKFPIYHLRLTSQKLLLPKGSTKTDLLVLLLPEKYILHNYHPKKKFYSDLPRPVLCHQTNHSTLPCSLLSTPPMLFSAYPFQQIGHITVSFFLFCCCRLMLKFVLIAASDLLVEVH